MDLFNNPMVDSAKRALTDEQKEEYKRMGEYMYNNQNYNTVETSTINSNPDVKDFAMYAVEALKSGLDPSELSQKERHSLLQVYGENWYEHFGLTKDDIPKESLNPEEVLQVVEEKAKQLKLNRKQRRALERKLKKEKQNLKMN